MFLDLICKLKARIYELEFSLSTKRLIGLIGTEKSCPMIVDINSNSIDDQTRPLLEILENKLLIEEYVTYGDFTELLIRDLLGILENKLLIRK